MRTVSKNKRIKLSDSKIRDYKSKLPNYVKTKKKVRDASIAAVDWDFVEDFYDGLQFDFDKLIEHYQMTDEQFNRIKGDAEAFLIYMASEFADENSPIDKSINHFKEIYVGYYKDGAKQYFQEYVEKLGENAATKFLMNYVDWDSMEEDLFTEANKLFLIDDRFAFDLS